MKSKRLIRKSEVLEMTARSYSSIYRDDKAGRFPARVRLGPNSVGWYEHEVQEWVQTRQRVLHTANTGGAQS